MSRLTLVVICGLVGCMALPSVAQDGATAQAEPGAAAAQADDSGSTMSKASYLIGFNFAKNLKKQGAEIDMKQFMKGVESAMSGGEVGMET